MKRVLKTCTHPIRLPHVPPVRTSRNNESSDVFAGVLRLVDLLLGEQGDEIGRGEVGRVGGRVAAHHG